VRVIKIAISANITGGEHGKRSEKIESGIEETQENRAGEAQGHRAVCVQPAIKRG
jgi:hypothetical protein